MPITPRLARTLHATLGEEAAEDLVTWMQNVDTQRAELRELNELSFARIDARFDEARRAAKADLKDATAQVREEMQAGFARTDLGLATLREEMRVGLADVERRLERRIGDLIKWSFVFWVGAVGAIAMLARVLG